MFSFASGCVCVCRCILQGCVSDCGCGDCICVLRLCCCYVFACMRVLRVIAYALAFLWCEVAFHIRRV